MLVICYEAIRSIIASQKLLDEVRDVMRLLRYAIGTEGSYCDWITRFIHFHHLRSREQLLAAGAPEVERFQASLAVEGDGSASTRN